MQINNNLLLTNARAANILHILLFQYPSYSNGISSKGIYS